MGTNNERKADMQYFVSIENTPYHHWQVELLIESFKMKKMEDQLVIGVARTDDARGIWSKNITNHKNKFLHENVGRDRNYLPLNKTFSLIIALENGLLKQPFAVIHPDMVLRNPIEIKEDTHNLVFDYSEDESLKDKIESEILKIKSDIGLPKDSVPWIPLGDVMVFMRDIPTAFFYRVGVRMEKLLDEHGPEKWIERAAWILTMYDYLARVNGIARKMETSLLHDTPEVNFVHYKFGMPPVFHKKYFAYDYKGTIFSIGKDDPMDALLEQNPTSNSNHVQEVVRSYKKHD